MRDPCFVLPLKILVWQQSRSEGILVGVAVPLITGVVLRCGETSSGRKAWLLKYAPFDIPKFHFDDILQWNEKERNENKKSWCLENQLIIYASFHVKSLKYHRQFSSFPFRSSSLWGLSREHFVLIRLNFIFNVAIYDELWHLQTSGIRTPNDLSCRGVPRWIEIVVLSFAWVANFWSLFS